MKGSETLQNNRLFSRCMKAYELSRNLQGEKNRHVLEERNLKPLQDEDDEEAKYSAVIGNNYPL